MEYSERIQKVKPSPTLTINAKALEMKNQGKDIISLAAGEPDFSPPIEVMNAAKEAIDKGFNKYTPVAGMPEILEAVANYFIQLYNTTVSKEMVIVTNGGKQALYNLFQILLNQDDEVLIPSPYWVSYPDMVLLADGKPVIVPTEPDQNFLVDIQDLERYLTPKSKILILNSPSNPTGCHYTQENLDQIVKWAIDKGIFVVSDEIYDQLVYPPAKSASVSKWLERAPDQVAIVNGLSKSFALTGWRIGYLVSDQDIIKKMTRIQGQSTSNICSIAQKAALTALTISWDFLEEKRSILATRRDKALEVISSWNKVVCPKPDGAFYLFPQMDSYYNDNIKDSTSLCTYLLENAEVALVPGSAFGDDRCVRFSYALEEKTMIQALDRISKSLQKISQ